LEYPSCEIYLLTLERHSSLTNSLSLKAVHHITPTIEDDEHKTDDVDADFPDWWDDGKYTKLSKNQVFRNQSKKPSKANVQRILRIIYDVYYKA